MGTGLKASWNRETLDVAGTEDDPFGGVDITAVGMPIDLTAGVPKLSDELHRLIEKESRLFNSGITCPIKDHDDSCCSVCPVSKLGKDDPLAALCRVGVRQEEVLTGLVAARHGG